MLIFVILSTYYLSDVSSVCAYRASVALYAHTLADMRTKVEIFSISRYIQPIGNYYCLRIRPVFSTLVYCMG